MFDFRRHSHLISVAVFLAAVLIFSAIFPFIVKASSETDPLEAAFNRMGTSQDSYFSWCHNQFGDFFNLLDKSMNDAMGIETNFNGIWNDTLNDVTDAFADVENEEDAWNRLEEYVNNNVFTGNEVKDAFDTVNGVLGN